MTSCCRRTGASCGNSRRASRSASSPRVRRSVARWRARSVRPSVLLRNVQRTVRTREELIDSLSALLKRRLLVLEGAPDHHVGMYLMPVGGRAVVVGDPRLAEAVLAKSPEEAEAVAAFLPD